MILGPVRDILLTSATVTGLIASRLFPFNLPQGATLPAADMRVVTTASNNHLGGNLGLYSSSITIDCYSKDMVEADNIAMAMLVDGLLAGFRGTQGSVFISGADVSSGISHAEEGVDPGSDEHRYVSSISFTVHWSTCAAPGD